MNLSDYADAMTGVDAQRLGAVLRHSPILDDPELMRQIRGIRAEYPDDHWWWIRTGCRRGLQAATGATAPFLAG
jgi:hypothetical protein